MWHGLVTAADLDLGLKEVCGRDGEIVFLAASGNKTNVCNPDYLR